MHKFRLVNLGVVAWVSLGVGGCPGSFKPRISCSPSHLRQGQTLRVRLPNAHGGEFGVWTPDNRFLFIAYQFDHESNPIEPPIPMAEFVKMRSLELATETTNGIELSEHSGAERVFTRSGKYRFIVSENLETEDDAHVNLICDVQYESTSKK